MKESEEIIKKKILSNTKTLCKTLRRCNPGEDLWSTTKYVIDNSTLAYIFFQLTLLYTKNIKLNKKGKLR